MRVRVRGWRACGHAATAVAMALSVAASTSGRAIGAPSAGEPRFSLLAVGDTGEPGPLDRAGPLAAVGEALAREDRRHPVNALVLLGDNFYPHGLLESELVSRLRSDVVGPFCHFVDLSGARSAEVAPVCGVGSSRHPVPIYVVLGNHDYESPRGPRLERERVPLFVANWHVARGLAETIEFPAGVSLVLVDSVALAEGSDPTPLREAIRTSRGPWRILAVHQPVVPARDRSPHARAVHARYQHEIQRVLHDSGVQLHLVLSGDEHNLQLIEIPGSSPRLQVVAGSGSKPKRLRSSNPRIRFELSRPGFARVDLVERGGHAALDVSLLSVETSGSGAGSRRVALWRVARDGRPAELSEAPTARPQ
jgi:hypothetical protein